LKVNRHFGGTSAGFQGTTRRYVPEDRNLHNDRCENLKSYICFLSFTLSLSSSVFLCFCVFHSFSMSFSVFYSKLIIFCWLYLYLSSFFVLVLFHCFSFRRGYRRTSYSVA
jgi:hypothetical protein